MGGISRCVLCGTNAPERKYFRFPSPPDIRNKWLHACNLIESEYLHSHRICDTHFQKCDFALLKKEGSRPRLKKNIIPTQSLEPTSISHLSVKTSITYQSDKKSKVSCIICGSRELERSYHRFPKTNTTLRKKWLDVCNLNDNNYSSSMRICGIHFENTYFYPSHRGGSIRLKNNAVPTLHILKNDAVYTEVYKKQNYKRKTTDAEDCTPTKYQKLSTNTSSNKQHESTDTVHMTTSTLSCTAEELAWINDSSLDILECIPTQTSTEISSNTNGDSLYISETTNFTEITSTNTMIVSEEEGTLSSSNRQCSSIITTPTGSKCLNKQSESSYGSSEENDISDQTLPSTPKKKGQLLWRYAADIHSPHIQTPNSAHKAVKILKDIILKERRTNHNLRRQLNRARHRIQTLEGVLNGFKKRKLLSNDIMQPLMVSLGISP